jgi:uncharacterized coiled-coil DUF342 family protein
MKLGASALRSRLVALTDEREKIRERVNAFADEIVAYGKRAKELDAEIKAYESGLERLGDPVVMGDDHG